MKKLIVILSATILFFAANNNTFAQSDNNTTSNGIIEIIDVYTPHFVAFRFVQWEDVKKVTVYFISGREELQAEVTQAKNINIGKDWETSYSEKTIITALRSSFPNTFRLEKLKFIVDGIEIFYNVSKEGEYYWEPIMVK